MKLPVFGTVAITLLAVASPVLARPDMPQASQHAVCGPEGQGTARCHAHVVDNGKGTPVVNVTPTGYGPAQFAAAYGITGSSTATIAIVDAYDDPNAESDLNVYSNYYGLPSCTTANGCFKKIDQRGGTRYPRGNAGWALEISLDLQAAHAACPTCKLLLVEADSNSFANLMAAEDRAAAMPGVAAISNSWGGSEFSSETTYDSHFNHPGIATTVSSGDSGYGAEYPAASQYVTAVGGTTLAMSGATYTGETAWSGAGSGCSAYESKPVWQTDSGCARRSIADVSADADPATGASVYDSVVYQGQKGWFKVGGTSLAAPLVAAVYAEAGIPSGAAANALPYATPSGLHDVFSGSNGSCGTYLCIAGAGYDGPTGVGTPFGLSAF